MKRVLALLLSLLAPMSTPAQAADWRDADLATIVDDDLARHAGDTAFLEGLTVSETRFSENGFDWHLIRFVNTQKPDGPLWAVPHDDENAAFEAAISSVKRYGGVAIMVNSGPESSRMQPGFGTCGGRPAMLSKCDPNRNFSDGTPLYTDAWLSQLPADQPIIALHTNSPGYGRGQGDITILDADAAARGEMRPRADGYFGIRSPEVLKNPDTYAIIPYLPPSISPEAQTCRSSLVSDGINVWHERVGRSDGSLSNYVMLKRSEISYVNMESRRETDIALAAKRHRRMVAAYLRGCR